MGEGEPETMPFAFLEDMDGSEDPRRVLRRAAESIVPFLESKMRQVVARWVYFKRVAGVGLMPLPFDPDGPADAAAEEPEVPRGLHAPRGAARDGCASTTRAPRRWRSWRPLHSYVFLQHVMEVLEKPMPLERYLETVLDVWTRGAIVTRRKTR